MKRPIHTLLLLAPLVGACSSTSSVEQLEKPALIWNQMRGLCGKVTAVDADGTVWGEDGGCEDGGPALHAWGRTLPDKLEALRQAFDVLPVPPSAEDCRGEVDVFSRWDLTTRLDWRTCAAGPGYNDATALAEPFASLASSFLSLLRPPLLK